MSADPPSPVTGDKWPAFRAAVEAVFPGICPEHARQMAPVHNWDPVGFIAHTLDQQEAGHSYPTRPLTQKRKRGDDKKSDVAGLLDQIKNQGNEFAQKTWKRRRKGFYYDSSYCKASYFLLQIAFPRLYVKDIESTFKMEGACLYQTYRALREELGKPESQQRFACKKVRSKASAKPTDVHEQIKRTVNGDVLTKRQAEEDALEEFNAIHSLYAAKEEQEASSQETREEEAERERLNEEQARAEGTMGECGCCFDDRPINRMVYCTGDTPHYVCIECAKSFVKSKVGMSQWDIKCFAVEDCQGTFSHAQRALFIDDALATALDRLEQEQVLRDAGIDNLAHCPFCPYAAEYPPVEVNKEFVCDNPDCGAVTCRLCKGPTHIPKSCEEVRSETAAESARHQIEEDMTLALIRKCNKCKTPYLKVDGCNKIVCSKCATVQCYVCQATITDYSHFRQEGTPCYGRLHDNLDGQMALNVEKAEREAREKILKENAHIQEQHLGFKFSATVQQEDEQQRAKAQAAAQQNRPRDADGDNFIAQMVAEMAGVQAQAAAHAALNRHPHGPHPIAAARNNAGQANQMQAQPQGQPRAEVRAQIRRGEGLIRAEYDVQLQIAEQPRQRRELILQAHRAAGIPGCMFAGLQAEARAQRVAAQQAAALARALPLGHGIPGAVVGQLGNNNGLPQQLAYAAQNWPGQANPNQFPQRAQFDQPALGAQAPIMDMIDWRPVAPAQRFFPNPNNWGVAGGAVQPANPWPRLEQFPNPPVEAGMGIPGLTLPQPPNMTQGGIPPQTLVGMVDAADAPIRGNIGMADAMPMPMPAPAAIPGLFQQPVRPPQPEVIDLTGDENQQYLLPQAAAHPLPMGGAIGGL